MSDLDATIPRVFLVRHGETEWTKDGRYTGTTDLELTPAGASQVAATGARLVGRGRLGDPARVARVWVSPRKRARQTFELLFSPYTDTDTDTDTEEVADVVAVTVTEDIAEWDYGDYEGMVARDIRARRKEREKDGEGSEWNIWRDGCEGGESSQQVTERLDRLIEQIRQLQAPYMHGEKHVDVVLVAHGLILRAFVKRWLKYPLDNPLPMMMAPGAFGVLSYKNHDVDEPAICIGMALPS